MRATNILWMVALVTGGLAVLPAPAQAFCIPVIDDDCVPCVGTQPDCIPGPIPPPGSIVRVEDGGMGCLLEGACDPEDAPWAILSQISNPLANNVGAIQFYTVWCWVPDDEGTGVAVPVVSTTASCPADLDMQSASGPTYACPLDAACRNNLNFVDVVDNPTVLLPCFNFLKIYVLNQERANVPSTPAPGQC